LIRELSSFEVLVGLDSRRVMERVARLDKTAIKSFEPFDKAPLLAKVVCEDDISTLEQVQANNKAFAERMFILAQEFRRRATEKKANKFSNISQALQDPALRSLISGWITNKGSRPAMLSDDLLYDAVMENQYLSRYFKTMLYMLIRYSRWWIDEHECHNVDPDFTGNDWTDFTLGLYAADGDIILANDKAIRNATAMIEPHGAVVVKTAHEL
jgi:hypothetical protein